MKELEEFLLNIDSILDIIISIGIKCICIIFTFSVFVWFCMIAYECYKFPKSKCKFDVDDEF